MNLWRELTLREVVVSTGMDFSLDADVFASTNHGEYDLFYPSEPFI